MAQSVSPEGRGLDPENVSPASASSRARTRSCAECRRRRIRCEGQTIPCKQCLYYQVEERCHYPQRQSRRALTAKAYDDLSVAYEMSRGVLERLFPACSVERLNSLCREDLLGLLAHDATHTTSTSVTTTTIVEQQHIPGVAAPLCKTPTIAILGYKPSRVQEFVYDERVDGTYQHYAWVDDVNGMTALFDTESGRSYLGISSVPAILHVLAHTSPRLRQAVEERKKLTDTTFSVGSVEPSAGHVLVDEPTLIDGYFRTFHILVPMVDEIGFRECLANGGGTDKARGPWLALLNMILTLGYISLNNDSQAGHAYFADRASEHLNLECFAAGHLHTLQALILLGGLYLHCLNKPNMASAIMGAAHRMALAMGLHQSAVMSKPAFSRDQRNMETRARTWWCLFCLDTWAGTTLGRPFPGAWDPYRATAHLETSHGELDYERLSLNASVSYSIIAARIQDRLAQTSLISPSELASLDTELLDWHNKLCPILRSGRYSPEPVRLAALLMQYRFLNLRMLLYRPYLLVRTIKAGSEVESSTVEDAVALSERCCSIAKETVDTITRHWYPSQGLAWHSSWYIFQACLVILLRLLSLPISQAESDAFESSIEQALEMLTKIQPWRRSAAQTRDLIHFIYSSRASATPTWESSSWTLSDDDLMSLLGFGEMIDQGSGWIGDVEGVGRDTEIASTVHK